MYPGKPSVANQISYWNGSEWVFTALPSGGTPAGLNGSIQYNAGGVFGGTVELDWSNAGRILSIGNSGVSPSNAGLYLGNGSLQITSGVGNTTLQVVSNVTSSVTFSFSASDTTFTAGSGNLSLGANGTIYKLPTTGPQANAILAQGPTTPTDLVWYVPTGTATVSSYPALGKDAAGLIVGSSDIAWGDFSGTAVRELVIKAGIAAGDARIRFQNSAGTTIGVVGALSSNTSFHVKRQGSGNLILNDVSWPGTLTTDDNFLVASNSTTIASWTQTPTLRSQTTLPAAPVDGAAIFSQNFGGRRITGWVDTNNIQALVQEFLGGGSIGIWKPPGNANTQPSVFGMANYTLVGTATARNVATTNLLTRMKRLGLVSAAAINSPAQARVAVAQITSGAGSLGGFFKVMRFAVSDAVLVADATMFVGIGPSGAIAGGTSPATLTNCFGVGRRSTDTNMQLFYGGSAAQAPVDLGSPYPSNQLSTPYELVIFCPPTAASTIYFQLTNLATGASTGVLSVTGTVGTQLPASTTLLSQSVLYRSTVAGAAAVGLDLISDYTWGNN